MKIRINYSANSLKDEESSEDQIELLHQTLLDMRNLKNYEFNHLLVKFFQRRLMQTSVVLTRFLGDDTVEISGFEKDIILLLVFFISQDSSIPEGAPVVPDEGMSMSEMKLFWNYAFPNLTITIA